MVEVYIGFTLGIVGILQIAINNLEKEIEKGRKNNGRTN